MAYAHKTEFKIIPDNQELAAMNRELAFFPASTASPKAFTKEQVEAYNREGFLSPVPIFSPSEILEHRRYFDDLLAKVTAAGGDSYSISSAHLKYGRIYDLLCDRRIVDRVADLLGENVVGWGSHYFCKMPHDGKRVAWHQDASYWPMSISKTVTVWLAVDDADQENACVRFLPKTHLLGPIEWRASQSGEGNVLNQTVENIDRFGEPFDAVLKAGEVSFHSDLLLHGSEANNSTRRRCGLTLRYCTTDVRAGLDWHLKGVVVRGADPSGHWANPRRPSSDS